MSDDLERALREALSGLEAPPGDVAERVRSAALASLPSTGGERAVQPSIWARLRRRANRGSGGWRRIGPLALAGALVIGGAALAAVLSTQPSADHRTADFASASAQAHFQANPELADAPWLQGSDGFTIIQMARSRPSLEFPPGVGYGQAVQSFYDAVSRRGELPPGTRLGPPLPRGVVVSLPGGARRGVALDLRAPFGYSVPDGRILQPIFIWTRHTISPPAAPQDWATRLPVGVRVITPQLESCQIARGSIHNACPLTVTPPEAARPGSGMISVPRLESLPVGVALRRAQAAGFALMVGGWRQAWSAGAIARARRRGALPGPLCFQDANGDPPSIDAFRERGPQVIDAAIGCYPAAELVRGEPAAPGAVAAQVPPAGSTVPWGSTVALAVAADDCLRAGSPDWCVPGAEASRARKALLAHLPWLTEPAEEPSITRVGAMPALAFPPGTTYPRAVRALVARVVEGGALPNGVDLAPALPRGIVLEHAPGGGLLLSLAAPFGYDPGSGAVLSFQRLLDSDRTPPYREAIARALRSGRVLPLSFVLAVREGSTYMPRPSLASCEVMTSEATRKTCPALG